MSVPRVAGLIALLGLLVAPSAAAQLPVGEADGVRIFRQHGIVVKFTAKAEKLRRQVAGRRVSVWCTDLPTESKGFVAYSSGGSTYRWPKRGRTLRTGDLTRGLDYCRVALVRRRPRSKKPIVAVPLTQAGAVYLDEEKKATQLVELFLTAGLAADGLEIDVLPTHAALIEYLSRRRKAPPAEVIARRIPALATPADTPPLGRAGYYSDGAGRAAVVVVSATGRRLFLEFEPEDVVRTNVGRFIDLVGFLDEWDF